jgi:hypothetical protein
MPHFQLSRYLPSTKWTMLLTLLTIWLAVPSQGFADSDAPTLPMKVPVLVIKFFPVKGDRIDLAVTGDWDASLEETRLKTDKLTKDVIHALQEGSRYHGYKDTEAQPSLAYEVVDQIELLEPMPTIPRPGHRVPFTDYKRIMERVKIKKWVEERGVKEVWIWGYHGGVLVLWESNMASPFGDISNSNRDPNDLPILKSTYTVLLTSKIVNFLTMLSGQRCGSTHWLAALPPCVPLQLPTGCLRSHRKSHAPN